MNQDIAGIRAYACPHCHRLLEAGDEGWLGWLLCPGCGQPGLPPARLRRPRPLRSRLPAEGRDNLPPGPTPEAPAFTNGPAVLAPPLGRSPAASGAGRLIVRTGLVVSLVLLFFAYLERSTPNLAVFGFLTVVFFVLLLWLPRPR